MEKVFSAKSLQPGEVGVFSAVPLETPFFFPHRVKIKAVSPEDPNREMDMKIGAVTIGGSPQMAINSLTPGPESPSIRAQDLDIVSWSAFSTVGLARELQMTVLNPNKERLIAFLCIEGEGFSTLGSETDPRKRTLTFPDPSGDRKVEVDADEYDELKKTAYTSIREDSDRIEQIMGSGDVVLHPGEQRVIELSPTVCSLWEPTRIRYHGRSCVDDQAVPFCVLDGYCGNKLLYGSTSIGDLFTYREKRLEEEFREFTRLLPAFFDAMSAGDNPDFERLQNLVNASGKRLSKTVVPHGMLTSLLHDESGWEDVRHWELLSTSSLNREAGIVAFNPWSFPISVGATLKGYAVSSLEDSRPPFRPGNRVDS